MSSLGEMEEPPAKKQRSDSKEETVLTTTPVTIATNQIAVAMTTTDVTFVMTTSESTKPLVPLHVGNLDALSISQNKNNTNLTQAFPKPIAVVTADTIRPSLPVYPVNTDAIHKVPSIQSVQSLITRPGAQQVVHTEGPSTVSTPKQPGAPQVIHTDGPFTLSTPKPLHITTLDPPAQHLQINPTSNATWTTDGKVKFQLSSTQTTILGGTQSKPLSSITAAVPLATLNTARYPAPQIVTLHNRIASPTSLLIKSPFISKPVTTITTVAGKLPIQHIQQVSMLKPQVDAVNKSGEPIRIHAPTQISFQVPPNWNPAAIGSKSLLEHSGKVSLVTRSNSIDGKSLLPDNKIAIGSDTLASTVGVESPRITIPKLQKSTAVATVVTKTIPANKAVANINIGPGQPANKVIANIGPGQPANKVIANIGPGQPANKVIANIGPGQLIAVPRTSKSGSFVINNNKYTIMPSSSNTVLTQLVKTDTKVNKAKITMAEAQIMLPSGPAKISWPVQQQVSSSENKPIMITNPVIQKNVSTSKYVFSKPPMNLGTIGGNINSTAKISTNMSPVATARVIEMTPTKAGGQIASWEVGALGSSTKTSVLPAQKNWELVKQSSLSQKSTTSPEASNGITEKPANDSHENNGNDGQDKSNESENSKSEKSPESNTTHSESGTISNKSAMSEEKMDTEELTESVNIKVEKDSEKDGTNSGDSLASDDSYELMDTDDDKQDKAGLSDEDTAVGGEVDGADKEDFDPVDAMKWEDGVGELPGSNLKFQMNDLGVLEVISDDLECTETLNTSNESEMSGAHNNIAVKDIKKEKDPDVKVKQEPTGKVSNKDEITQCQNCGEYGFTTDFYKEGRFCSQTCVGAFDSKHMRGVKKHGHTSRMVLGLKKGRKKLLLKDGFHQDKDIKTEQPPSNKKSKAFVWTRYLEQENAVEAPAKLFKNPFPAHRNFFRTGMKLEGVDPTHQSLFCVLSVAEVSGYRVRLHFDGHSECYDYWTDIDSPYIYPVGFCEKHGKVLQPPKGFSVDDFSWTTYLKNTKGSPAPKTLFSNQPTQSVTPNLFRVGSKLEAVDKKNSSLICVASVADTLGDKVLIHFDSWDDNYDYWCDMTSPFIHPTGYCDETGLVLSPPIDWKDASGFTWEKFLSKTKTQAVPARAFKHVSPVSFEVGMKVEVVDKRNPILVRVATIAEVENYMVRVHFDGWSESFDYWLDDDCPDLHPPGWCAKTGHPLVPPISPSDLIVGTGPGVCPTPGCKGIGHIKGSKYSGHHSTFGCPYSDVNMNKESVLGDRLGKATILDEPITTVIKHEEPAVSPEPKRCPTEGCDGSGHVTGKCLTHYKASGCPLLHAANMHADGHKKFGRGRRPKSYYQNLEQKTVKEQEQDRHEKEEHLRQGIHNSVFASSMISTPRTEVPLNWGQHSKLLPGVTNICGNDVNKWSIEQVAAFVNTLPGCAEQAKMFKEEQIDGEALLLLTQADIVKIMNIKLGPALKIFNSIIMFKNSVEV